jgi:chaperonin GroES
MPTVEAQQPATSPEAPAAMPSVEEQDKFELDKALQSLNLAETIRKRDERKGTSLLEEIGDRVCEDFDTDDASRENWLKRNKEWMKLATQVVEKKMFPWEGAANVKYPLLTTAAIQFGSRAYPALIPSFDIVKAKVLGPDPDGKLTDVANTLSTHMSYQILYEMDGWEEDLDVLCFVLPIVGVVFKKTYYSEKEKKNVSELVSAKDLVVNYYTKSLKKAARYTHVLYYTANEIKECQNYGQFLEYDEPFGPGMGDDFGMTENATSGTQSVGAEDDDTPRKILEQYRRIDLDDDDYKEPYIVTVDYETRQVLRITPNFRSDGVEKKDDKVLCIKPCDWFTKFGFIPNPDGGFYDLGFGLLLGGINESVNTLTNQILDSGTINNMQAGFLAKGLRLTERDLKFKVGEWKVVNALGDDLRKSIVPLPSNPPSPVLFQLLGTLAQAGKELASVAEIFTGKMPGQNTPAATTMATIEQGLKVFTSIYKRIYRSMQQEFMKLYELNRLYMPSDQTIKFVMDVNGKSGSYSVSKFDYQGMKVKIMPAADPNMVSETQKLMKIQGLHELVQYGNINVKEMTRQALTFQGQENITELMTVPQAPPPVEIQIKQMELQDKAEDRKLEAFKVQSEHLKRQSEIALNIAKAKQAGDEQSAMILEAQLTREEAAMEMQMKVMDLMFKKQEHQMDMAHDQEKHQMDMKVKDSEARLNLATKSVMANQNIQHNEAKNEKSIELMGDKAKAKEKLSAKSRVE